MRRSVIFIAIVAVAAVIGTIFGAERKLGTLANQSAFLAQPNRVISTAVILGGDDLETALQGLYEVSPTKAQSASLTQDAILNLPAVGFRAAGEVPEETQFFAPELGVTALRTFEHGPISFRVLSLARDARSQTRAASPSAGAQSEQVIEITPLAPGTRIAIRVIRQIPSLSSDCESNRTD